MQTEGKATGLGRALPGLGYAVALVACAVAQKSFVARWGATGGEVSWCVLAPGLFALVHVLTRRMAQGGRGFRLLGVLWGGAAVIGLASHWRGLGAAGPWLSLIRYALIAAAGCLFCVSVMVSRPLFAARGGVMPLFGRIALGVLGGAMLLAWVGALAMIVYMTPFAIALAPRERGLQYERVLTSDWRDYVVWMAWSPDSRRLVGQGARGLVVVDPAGKSQKVVWPHGIVDPDRPWDADGQGFYFARPGTSSDRGVWYVPLDGRQPRKIVGDLTGIASCSPDGRTLAYNGSRGTTLVDSAGGRARVLCEQSGIPIWAPDGKHMLVLSERDHQKEVYLVSMDGAAHKLWGPPADLGRAAWVDGSRFATLTVAEAARSLGVRVAEVTLWDLEGEPIKHYSLGRYAGGSTGTLAATRDGGRLAIGLDFELTPGSSLVMLDLKTGRLTRLPAPDYSAGPLAWSPDGRSLAISDVVEEEHEHGYSYVAVISGFKLFKKGEAW